MRISDWSSDVCSSDLVESGRAAAAWDNVVDGVYALTADAGLAVGDVLVTGRNETDAADLLDVLGVERGMPILAIDLEALQEHVVALPWVRTARGERHLPDTLFLAITQGRPLAPWQRHRTPAPAEAELGRDWWRERGGAYG